MGLSHRKPRPKSSYDFLSLLYCFIVLWYVTVVFWLYMIYFPAAMAQCSLFVLKMPLNTKQTKIVLLHGIFHVLVMSVLTGLWCVCRLYLRKMTTAGSVSWTASEVGFLPSLLNFWMNAARATHLLAMTASLKPSQTSSVACMSSSSSSSSASTAFLTLFSDNLTSEFFPAHLITVTL